MLLLSMFYFDNILVYQYNQIFPIMEVTFKLKDFRR